MRSFPITPVHRYRRWVLALAALAGFGTWLALSPSPDAGRAPAEATGYPVAAWVSEAQAATTEPLRRVADAPAAPKASDAPAAPKAPDAPEAADRPAAPDVPATPRKGRGKANVGITLDEDGDKVTVSGFGTRHEYDSFNEFVDQAPWLAGLVFLAVTLVFLFPLLVIVLIVWYKMRRTRMLNETMLKLAEKGIVPPAEALDALGGNRGGAGVYAATPSTAPLYEQAKQLRKRAAWSDLRKGIIMGGIGLGLTFFSMLDDGTPNSVGLILLFVGLGFIVLWYLEDRQAAPADRPGPPATGA